MKNIKSKSTKRIRQIFKFIDLLQLYNIGHSYDFFTDKNIATLTLQYDDAKYKRIFKEFKQAKITR